MDPVLLEILKESGGFFLWEISKWTVLGIIVGAFITIPVYFLLKMIGAYRMSWAYAKACRIFVFVTTLLISISLTGLIGFNQGLLVAAERSLQSGELRENILPSIGSAAADLLAAIYVVAPELTKNESNWTQSTENLDAQLKAFQQGEWKLDINELIRRLKNSKTKVLQEIISMMNRSLKKDYPLLNEGIGEKIYTWFTNHFAESVIEGTIKGELESNGSLYWVETGLAGLKEAGASDQKVSHHDLSIVIAEALIDKGIIGPLRSAVRLQQIILLVTLLVLFVGPALTIRIADFAISRTQSKQA